MQMDKLIPEKTKKKDINGFLTLKILKLLKKVMSARTQLQFQMTIQSERTFKGAKFNNSSRSNWKPLFEVNFSYNSTKTIRLFALDFYEALGPINYHLIEISSS